MRLPFVCRVGPAMLAAIVLSAPAAVHAQATGTPPSGTAPSGTPPSGTPPAGTPPGSTAPSGTTQPSMSSSSVGMLIDKGGAYSLTQDMMVAQGDAIMITASGVTLDLRGHVVGAANPGQGRGIVVEGARGVRITNGMVGPFGINVEVHNSENVVVEAMQVVGANLGTIVSSDPNNSRAEIGILLLDSRGCAVRGNTVTSINTGIFLRGGGTTGNRVENNTVSGGPNSANNSFGMCCNPAVGEGEAGPTGNVITGNHVSRYHNTIQINGNSPGNFFKGNTLAYFDNAHIFAGNEKDMLPKETVIEDDLAYQLTP